MLWVELDIPHSDRDTFRRSYCLGVCTVESAKAVAEHLALLLRHQRAGGEAREHIEHRENCLKGLQQELRDYLNPSSSLSAMTTADGRKQRVRRLLLSLVRQGTLVVEAIQRWRATLWRPCAFTYSGVSYLQKMQTDADFLFTADGARMLAGLGVAPEEAALASFPVALLGNREPEDMPVALRQAFERFPSMRRRVAGAAKVLAAEPTRHLKLQLESQRLLAHGVYIPFLRWTPPANQVRGTAGKQGWVQAGASDSESSEEGVPVRDVTRPTASTLAKRFDAPPDRSTRRAGVMEDFRTLTPQVGDGDEGMRATRRPDTRAKSKHAGRGAGIATSRGSLQHPKQGTRGGQPEARGTGGRGGRAGGKKRDEGSHINALATVDRHQRRGPSGVPARDGSHGRRVPGSDGIHRAAGRTVADTAPAYRTGQQHRQGQDGAGGATGATTVLYTYSGGDGTHQGGGELRGPGRAPGGLSGELLGGSRHAARAASPDRREQGREGSGDPVVRAEPDNGPVYVTRGGPSAAWA